MNDIKAIIAKNLVELRQAKKMTQYDLAALLNYSDKAVSKWERAESLPDVTVLVAIADIFDVSLDYLVHEVHPKKDEPSAPKKPAANYNRPMITAVSLILVWLIAIFAFVISVLVADTFTYQWLAFVYAVPVTAVVWLIFNSIWFNPRRNYFIISLLMWSALATIHTTALPFGINVWLVYLIGIPAQVIVLFWSMIKKPKNANPSGTDTQADPDKANE